MGLDWEETCLEFLSCLSLYFSPLYVVSYTFAALLQDSLCFYLAELPPFKPG